MTEAALCQTCRQVRLAVSDLKEATNVNKVCDGGGAGRAPAEPAGQVGSGNRRGIVGVTTEGGLLDPHRWGLGL